MLSEEIQRDSTFAFESVPVPNHYWLNEIMLRIRNQDEDENEDDANDDATSDFYRPLSKIRNLNTLHLRL